jgi:sialidase-1
MISAKAMTARLLLFFLALPLVASTLPEDLLVVPMVPGRTHRGATGSIVALKDGALLFAYGNPQHWTDTSRSGILGRISRDGGRTWGEPFLMQKNVARYATLQPSLLRLSNGDLLFGYNVMNNFQGPDVRFYDGKIYVRRSTDDGATWGDPICATPYPSYHTVNPQRLIQLSTGRIVLPAEWTLAVGGGEAGHMVSLCYFTDDGYTWVRGRGVVDVGSTTEEPSVVELSDGRLFMVFRNRNGYVGRAYSTDRGDTWTDVGYLDLPSPLAPQTVTRIPSTGDLLLVWLNNPLAPALARKEVQPIVPVGEVKRPLGALRTPLSTAISRDQGRTWEHIHNLAADPGGDYGYQSVTFVGDTVLINYHSLQGIHIARVPVAWLYAR